MASDRVRPRPVDVIDRRVGLLFGLFALLLLVALLRAGYLGLFRSDSLQTAATREQVSTEPVPAIRGTITDRNGVVLALSEQRANLIANPFLIKHPAQLATQLVPLVGVSYAEVYASLTKPHTGYSIIARDVPGATATAIESKHINGISTEPAEQRVYPRGTLAAQVLGWVGSNPRYDGGLEYLYNDQLAGRGGRQKVVNDAHGQAISISTLRPVSPGKPIALTISAPLQSEVEHVLAGVAALWSPKAATAIVMDPNTGQVLALANWPQIDSNHISATPLNDTEDYGVGFSYEPGSTFKAITIAGALADGVVTPDTVFTLPPSLSSYGYTITDAEAHGYESKTVAQILQVSSNIGADLIGQRMGATSFSKWVARFGFGRPTGIDLPGEQDGVTLALKNYSGVSMVNLPFGQGQEVTPIQMATAYSAIANGGILRRPTVVQSIGGVPVRDPKGTRVISAAVAAELRDMLRGVLGEGGTASGAWIKDYDLAGKTGTAQVAANGKYSSTKFVASFIGMVPASAPKLVVAVVVDEPHGAIYGGSVAAPAFQKIVGWAVPYLGINPCPAPCPASATNPALQSAP